MTTTTAPTTTTSAFVAQAWVSFGVALSAAVVGVWNLPADRWVRAFLALALLYAVTSAFTLAKCLRDIAEASSVRVRLDEARLEKLLADHDPFASPAA
jgi:hypothetical protein